MKQHRVAAASLFALGAALRAAAQLAEGPDGNCLFLQGSSVCPSFPVYIGVGQLASQYPFMADVTDTASFDKAAEAYFTGSGPNDWPQTKYDDELGCNKAQSAVVQWQRTVMCATWAHSTASQACMTHFQGSTSSVPYLCSDTCTQFGNSEKALTQNTQFCSARDSSGVRSTTLATDLQDCYDLTRSTCISGLDNEPGTCGFGSDLTAACAFCSTQSSESCCSSVSCPADGSSPSSSGTTSSSPTGTSKGSSNAGSKSKGLSGGAIAGIVIGVIAGLIILGLLIFFCMRRRRNSSKQGHLLRTPPTEKLDRQTSTPLSVPDHHDEDHFAARNTSPFSNSHAAPVAAGAAGAGMAGVGAAALANKHRNAPVTGSAAPAAPAAASAAAPAATSAAAAPAAAAAAGSGSSAAPIGPGSMATAVYPYTAALDDELTLEPGMKIHVHEVFDDGWATGTAKSGGPVAQLGKLGKFPMVCVGQS